MSRAPVAFEAQLRVADLSKVKIRVVEISTHGFRAMTAARLNPGDSVYLHIPSLNALHAMVRWVENSAFGCEFLQPLYAPVAEHIARQYPDHYRPMT